MSTDQDSEGQAVQPVVTEAVPTVTTAPEAPREKMIETAMKFLLNPQVRSSLLVQKKAFLRKKGLTEREIELAVERSGTRQDVPKPAQQPGDAAPTAQGQVAVGTYPGSQPQHQMVPYMQPPPPSRVTSWRDYMAIAVIVSGVSFGIYKLIMQFLTPWLKRRREEAERLERIEASIQELNRNVAETVSALENSVKAIQTLLEKQETQIGALNAEILSSKALSNSRRSTDTTEIKAEITSLKGLLLNRHQFPATPQRSQIPAWQRSGDSSAKSNSPPAAAESASKVVSSSTPPPKEPIANGDLSSDHFLTSDKEVVQENGAAADFNPTPDESTELVERQTSPAANGTT